MWLGNKIHKVNYTVCWRTFSVAFGRLFDRKQYESRGGLSVCTFLIAMNALLQKCCDSWFLTGPKSEDQTTGKLYFVLGQRSRKLGGGLYC